MRVIQQLRPTLEALQQIKIFKLDMECFLRVFLRNIKLNYILSGSLNFGCEKRMSKETGSRSNARIITKRDNVRLLNGI